MTSEITYQYASPLLLLSLQFSINKHEESETAPGISSPLVEWDFLQLFESSAYRYTDLESVNEGIRINERIRIVEILEPKVTSASNQTSGASKDSGLMELDRISLPDLVERNRAQDGHEGFFKLESPYLLEVNLHGDGECWAKAGAMIAYQGEVEFARETLIGRGVADALRAALGGAGARLLKLSGVGRVFLADQAKRVHLTELRGETVHVNAMDILAVQSSLSMEATMIQRLPGTRDGGLFSADLTGCGLCALTTHATPIVLRVGAHTPVFAHPSSVVAWSEGVEIALRLDDSFRKHGRRESPGDGYRMELTGKGWVLLQPYEAI